MKHKLRFMVIATLTALLLIIGVPVAINEAYKCNSGYITVWGAPEVLSYYGTILGSIIAVATLSVTVLFTRKQIQRESYLKTEIEKWSIIEQIIAKALVDINPIRLLKEIEGIGQKEPCKAITTFQKYQMTCRTAMDELLSSVNNSDYHRIQELLEKISAGSDQYFQIVQEEIAAYEKLRNYLYRPDVQAAIKLENLMPHSFTPKRIAFCEKFLSDTEGLQMDDIQESIALANQKMVSAYETTYKPLLQLKGSIFESISHDIQTEADNILHFQRKK